MSELEGSAPYTWSKRQAARPGMRPDDLLLLERQREQAVLSSVLAGLGNARPGVVHVTGRPGYGQGALLHWAAQRAQEHGIRVLQARATPAESRLRYAGILQLLTSLCELAESSLKKFIENEQPDHLPGLAESLPAIREVPTLLIVEDLQWLDMPSLRWLQALTRRLFTGTPIALVTSGSGTTGRPDWLKGAHASPIATTELVLRTTTARGVATAVKLACGTEGDEEFTAAAEEATGTNPVVLNDVICHFADHGYKPVAERIPELASIADVVIGDHATRSLSELPGEALDVLRALAVCGDLLDFSLVCTLATLRTEPESGVRATLEAAGLTTSDGPSVSIRFPVVKDRVLEDVPAKERADLYARAAELAHRAAVNDDDIAAILHQAPPLGAPWVTATLRRSATAALWRGEYDRAAACLSRALLEPLVPSQRAQLNLELAEAEIVFAPEAGERRLSELALAGHGDSARTSLRAIDVGLARGNDGWARRVTADALAFAEGEARDDLIALHWLVWQDTGNDDELLLREVPPLPQRPRTPAQSGVDAWRLAVRGEHADTARELAREALSGDAAESVLVMPRVAACEVLGLTDDGDEARARIDELLNQVRRGPSRAATARVLAVRADLHLRGGRFDAAERDADAAELALPEESWHPLSLPYLLALRLSIALETGAYERARELADRPAPDESQEGVALAYLLFARARLAGVDGRWPDALALARECGRRLARCQWTNPGLLPWRSLAARAAQLSGNHEEAAQFSREEQALARRWGTASAISLAELFAEPLTGEPARDPLGVSDIPVGAPDRLAYAWGLTELAAAELGSGNAEAAARLLPGLTRFTTTYPSSRLAQRVRHLTEELHRPGGRDLPETWTTLSDAERRTAELAGAGHGNREIAELLSVSRRTVELRLSGTYRKLHVSGRDELRALMQTMEGRPSDAA